MLLSYFSNRNIIQKIKRSNQNDKNIFNDCNFCNGNKQGKRIDENILFKVG